MLKKLKKLLNNEDNLNPKKIIKKINKLLKNGNSSEDNQTNQDSSNQKNNPSSQPPFNSQNSGSSNSQSNPSNPPPPPPDNKLPDEGKNPYKAISSQPDVNSFGSQVSQLQNSNDNLLISSLNKNSKYNQNQGSQNDNPQNQNVCQGSNCPSSSDKITRDIKDNLLLKRLKRVNSKQLYLEENYNKNDSTKHTPNKNKADDHHPPVYKKDFVCIKNNTLTIDSVLIIGGSENY